MVGVVPHVTFTAVLRAQFYSEGNPLSHLVIRFRIRAVAAVSTTNDPLSTQTTQMADCPDQLAALSDITPKELILNGIADFSRDTGCHPEG